MNKIKIIVSLVLVLSMLLSISSFALFDGTDDVCVNYSTPVLDGEINKDDGWSDAVVLNNDTLSIINHSKHNPIDMNANAYLAYDDSYFYIAADITEFGDNMTINDLRCPSMINKVDGDTYGFDGDVFAFTVDFMSLLSEDSANHGKLAPFYCIGFDTDANGAVYHSNGTANELLTSENSDVKVVFTDNGWRFEAAVSFDVVIADICAALGVDELTVEQYIDLFYGNLDGKASFAYKSNRIDIEADEVITYAEYATVAETCLDGTPGITGYGTTVKTLGLIFYLNHEHVYGGYYFDGDEAMATFTKDGEKTLWCEECGYGYDTEVIPMIPFEDVKAGLWYETALIRCYNWEYFKGMSETKFGPNVTMTRAMFVQVIANFWGVDTSEYTCDQFTDVKPNHWYYGAVAWAYENGITSGVSDSKFAPNKALTREEAAALFANTIKVDGLYETPTITFDVKYTDVDKISPWAKESMLWAVENGIISGTSDTTLAPKGKATRMQVAQMLCKFEDHVISLIVGE